MPKGSTADIGIHERARPQDAVTVAMVTYNSANHVAEAIRSLPAAASDVATTCLVVDNLSADATPEVARSAGADVVETGANLGYSGGINVARRHVPPGRALLVANPDLRLRPDAIRRLAHALREPGVGVAVPRLLDPAGSVFPHLRREPSVLGALGDAIFGRRWRSRPRWATDTLLRPADYDHDHDVDWAGGAALMISSSCDQAVGPWDEDRYFLYSEETDYQHRVRAAGFRVRFVSAAEAVHDGGGSGQSAALVALMAVNRVRYFRSYHGPALAAAFRGVVALHHLLRCRDAPHRMALRAVLSTDTWRDLPGTAGRCSIAPSAQDSDETLATLCLHGVGRPGRRLEEGENRFWISRQTLDGILDAVLASDRPVELTVDDANASDYDEILPALLERNLTATFFVITDRIGTPGSLTGEQIQVMAEAGMTFGFHGATHAAWRELSDHELDGELGNSAARLAAITGLRVRVAACPRGSYDRRVVAALRRHGYERMYTVDGGASRVGSWVRTRYTITRFDTAESIAAWIANPRGATVQHTIRVTRSLLKRWR